MPFDVHAALMSLPGMFEHRSGRRFPPMFRTCRLPTNWCAAGERTRRRRSAARGHRLAGQPDISRRRAAVDAAGRVCAVGRGRGRAFAQPAKGIRSRATGRRAVCRRRPGQPTGRRRSGVLRNGRRGAKPRPGDHLRHGLGPLGRRVGHAGVDGLAVLARLAVVAGSRRQPLVSYDAAVPPVRRWASGPDVFTRMAAELSALAASGGRLSLHARR